VQLYYIRIAVLVSSAAILYTYCCVSVKCSYTIYVN